MKIALQLIPGIIILVNALRMIWVGVFDDRTKIDNVFKNNFIIQVGCLIAAYIFFMFRSI